MSETIQLGWRDNAVNETIFKIYRSTSSDILHTDVKIAEIEWDGTSWNSSIINSQVTGLSIIDTNGGPTATGAFKVEFVDSVSGDNYYGISAGNASGDSDIVPTTSPITI